MNVRDAVVQHIRHRQAMMDRARGVELQEHGPRLPVSQLGHCSRRCIFEAVRHHPEHPLHAEITHPYDEYVQEIMECGNVWERETSIALQQAYGNLLHWEKGDPVLRVGNEHWLGHVDFFVEECQQFPYGAVIEHKATNPNNFIKKGRLPYQFHCLQVLMYRRLLPQKWGNPKAYLYYRSWSYWAEFALEGKWLGTSDPWYGLATVPTTPEPRPGIEFNWLTDRTSSMIGVMYGNPETTPGGAALRFYASIRMRVSRVGTLGPKGKEYGIESKVRVVKNSVAAPFREAEFEIIWGQGICREADVLNVAAETGVVAQKGSWYYYNIEIVAVPRWRGQVTLMWGVEPAENMLDLRCLELLATGQLEKRPDNQDRYCWGTGVKRAVFFRGKDYAPVDLFQVIEPAQWGVIYAIRTGPGDFNHRLVTSRALVGPAH